MRTPFNYRSFSSTPNFQAQPRPPRPRFQKGKKAYEQLKNRSKNFGDCGVSVSLANENSSIPSANSITLNRDVNAINESASANNCGKSALSDTDGSSTSNIDKTLFCTENDDAKSIRKVDLDKSTNLSTKNSDGENSCVKKKLCKFKTHKPIPLPVSPHSVKHEKCEEEKSISTETNARGNTKEQIIKKENISNTYRRTEQGTISSKTSKIKLKRNNLELARIYPISDVKPSSSADEQNSIQNSISASSVLQSEQSKIELELSPNSQSKSPRKKPKIIKPSSNNVSKDDWEVHSKDREIGLEKGNLNITPTTVTDSIHEVSSNVDQFLDSPASSIYYDESGDNNTCVSESLLDIITNLSQSVCLRVESVNKQLTMPKLLKLFTFCGKVKSSKKLVHEKIDASKSTYKI